MSFWNARNLSAWIAGFALLIGTAGSAQQTDAPEVLTMNEHFREVYAKGKQDILAHIGAVILLIGDKAILLNKGKRQEAAFVPILYTLYKTIDHIPLMIFVSLRDYTDQPLSKEKHAELKAFIPVMAKTTQSMARYTLPPDIVARQKLLMDNSLAFLNETMKDSRVSSKELQAFTIQLRPTILSNANDAVALEVASLNKQIQSWRKEMTANEWNNLHVIIAGGHMPRQQSHYMQYFSALLKEHEEGRKLIYMEGVEDEQHALDLLATHLLDESIGTAFFRDSSRMHRDLLVPGSTLRNILRDNSSI